MRKHTVDNRAMQELLDALYRVWQTIAPDLYESAACMGQEPDNNDAVSACTEHLSMYGDNPDAVTTFRKLCDELGYCPAVKLLTSQLNFA